MGSQLVVARALQDELDKLVPPTTTGYMHAEERWRIAFIDSPEDYSDVQFKIGIDPPDGAYEWHCPSSAGLQTLKAQLGCDDIHARAVGGKIRYIARFNKEGTSP